MRIIFSLFSLFYAVTLVAQPKIDVELVATGFNEPVDIAQANDNRLFIVERSGIIKILFPNDSISVFMDITSIVGSSGGEQGLLGLAFHPDYVTNGYFYVNYTDTAGNTHISRFSRSLFDANLADVSTEFNLLYMNQPAANHNGGDLNFGPDGYLYIAMGDGGGAGHNRSQQIVDNKLGKILRIDVDSGSPYAIPPDNPFVGVVGDDEIWAMGLRNPWKSNFDRVTGDLWIADVGADSWEEIDFIAADTSAFMNFGWKCFEGNMLRVGTLCDTIVPDFDFPVYVYPHNIDSGGFAVTGGFVYRGSAFPNLYGKYIFCDYISGNFWTLEQQIGGGFDAHFYDYVLDHITAFGEDSNGELFACVNTSGNIYRIIDACANFDASLSITDATAPTLPNGAILVTTINGIAPFEFAWSNGATTQNIFGLDTGNYTITVTDNLGCSIVKSASINYVCMAATGITTTPTATTVNINWDDVGAAGYRVLYKPLGPGPYTQINTPISAINISGLSAGTPYTFKIRNKCPGAPGVFTASGNFITLPLKTGAGIPDITIYPNPGTGIFMVNFVNSNSPIMVSDLNGKIWGNYLIPQSGELNLSDLPQGLYHIYFPEYQIYKPIVIIH